MGKRQLRILIYQIGSIGDTVVSIPSLRAIRRHYGPNAEICLLHNTRPSLNTTPADLLRGGTEVDRFIGYPHASGFGNKLISAIQVSHRLRRERFQDVVYLVPSERTEQQVRRDRLFFQLSGIRRCIGFSAFPREVLYPVTPDGYPGKAMHEALCRLKRLQIDGIDISKEADLSQPFLRIPQKAISAVNDWLRKMPQLAARRAVAICPGSKQPANAWPEERFTEIGNRLVRKGNYELIVVGGPAETQIGRRMIQAWGKGFNAAGEFSVLESAALLGQCEFCIGLDTGTIHLAAAMGTPCVALYGGRDNQGRFEPLGERNIVLRSRVPCAGCRLIETPCIVPGHPCMTGIEVNDVWDAVQKMEFQLMEINP
jgi:heptosyltransferase III